MMFHVHATDYEISFSFRHYRDVNFEVRPGHKVTDVTYCDMLANGKEYSGLAACAKGDAFKKETGRKVALTRALAEAKLPKDVRTIIWERYHGRSKS